MYTKILPLIVVFFLMSNCKAQDTEADFVIAFGSCDDQKRPNNLWPSIIKQQPNLWIWGGDNIYSDTFDAAKMKVNYVKQLEDSLYQKILSTTPIMATWDDHDYGKNDAGVEYIMKKESQQLFLDFLKVDSLDSRRKQEGIYTSKIFNTPKGSINVIILDTRYFRTALTKATATKKRFTPNNYGDGTVLGVQQWEWLAANLQKSEATFNIIVSSIQLLSSEHGFETWGNFPHEQDRFYELIKKNSSKNILVLSGDRHISEFSKKQVAGLNYPLVDFTSSGLTHAYRGFKGEPNPYRIGDVIFTESFGVLRFNFDSNEIKMEIRGDNNKLLHNYRLQYPN
jgi:alkaline phosphatase D